MGRHDNIGIRWNYKSEENMQLELASSVNNLFSLWDYKLG